MKPPAKKRICVLVLGAHRSGTSALAGALAKLGATAPKTLMLADAANPKGYWESRPLFGLHEQVLAATGSSWSDWRAFNRAWLDTDACVQQRMRARQLLMFEFGQSRCFVFKDPRVCRLVEFWTPVFQELAVEPRAVLAYRSPLETALSLQKRNGFHIWMGVAIWLRHVLDAERHSRVMPHRSFVSLQETRTDWRTTLSRVARELDVALAFDDADKAAEVDAFLTADLWRERASAAQARLHPEIHEWAIETHEAHEALRLDPHAAAAMATLDRIGAAFDGACALFARMWSEQELSLASARDRVARVEARLRTLTAEASGRTVDPQPT